MDANTGNAVINGLISYLGLIILLTFHEFGHAWTALKCGDDTARLQGRVSLNPIVHIDPIGTILLPLMMIFLPLFGGHTGLTVSQFIIGWAKPVPVNPYNLRHPKIDNILVTMAGPGMNLVLAVMLVGLVRVGLLLHLEPMVSVCLQFASLSLLLCFFNLIPIPPLDGSHILRILTDMSWETYAAFAKFGFIAVILVLQIPPVRTALGFVTNATLLGLAVLFGIPMQ